MKNTPKTLIVFNEFYTLGKFPQMLEAAGRMRGYGVKFIFYCQSLSQMRELYGDAGVGVLIGNAGLVCFYGGTLDSYTAETLSKASGMQTLPSTSISENGLGVNISTGQVGRAVMMPDEIMRVRGDLQLLFMAGVGMMAELLIDRVTDLPEFEEWLAELEGRPIGEPHFARNRLPPAPDDPPGFVEMLLENLMALAAPLIQRVKEVLKP